MSTSWCMHKLLSSIIYLKTHTHQKSMYIYYHQVQFLYYDDAAKQEEQQEQENEAEQENKDQQVT